MEQLGFTFDLGVIALLWWAWLGLAAWILYRCVGYKLINCFTFFFPLLILTNGILVPFTRDINSLITGFEITQFDKYWTSLFVMYACLPLGVLGANLLRRDVPEHQRPAQVLQVGSPYRTKLYLGIVLLISVFSLAQIFLQGLQFDLIAYFSGEMDYAQYANHRYGFAQATAGADYYLYNKLPYGIAPLAVILVWNMAGLRRWQRWSFLAILSFALLQTGHKMPLMTILAYVVLSRSAIQRNLVFTRKLALGMVALFVATLLIILPGFYLLQGEGSYLFALYWSIIRTVGEPSRTLQLYFEVYPYYHDFLYGTSSRIIAGLAGVTDFVPPSVYIPTQILHLEETSFPTLFIGEAWADFGYWGVALTSIIVGFLLQLYNVWYFNKRSLRLEDTALFLSIAMGSIHLLEANFLTTLLTYGLAMNFVIYMLIKGERRGAGPAEGLRAVRPSPAL